MRKTNSPVTIGSVLINHCTVMSIRIVLMAQTNLSVQYRENVFLVQLLAA